MVENSSKKINLVIPMAGAGSRFAIEGYTVPKPFIEFNNKMMIEHVLNSFKNLNAEITLIIQQKFFNEQREQLDKLQRMYKVTFVIVPKLTMGAAITALAAHRQINSDYDIIFADSDNIFVTEDIDNFVKFSRKNNLDGALLTFNSNNPCFSYVKTDSNNLVIETKEKQVISNNAITGVYYFKNVDLFRNATIDLIVENDLSNGEFYMSNVYNHLLKFTNAISVFNINHFDCVGTPSQLKEYMERFANEKIQ